MDRADKPQRFGWALGQRGAIPFVEFGIACAGLIVFAFLSARVGVYLNDAMVARSDNFQGTRVAAASSAPGTGFAGPGGVHLIGPSPGATGGVGAQGAGPSAAARTCPGGDQKLSDAKTLRDEAYDFSGAGGNTLLGDAQVWRADLVKNVGESRAILDDANNLWSLAKDLQAIFDRDCDAECARDCNGNCGDCTLICSGCTMWPCLACDTCWQCKANESACESDKANCIATCEAEKTAGIANLCEVDLPNWRADFVSDMNGITPPDGKLPAGYAAKFPSVDQATLVNPATGSPSWNQVVSQCKTDTDTSLIRAYAEDVNAFSHTLMEQYVDDGLIPALMDNSIQIRANLLGGTGAYASVPDGAEDLEQQALAECAKR